MSLPHTTLANSHLRGDVAPVGRIESRREPAKMAWAGAGLTNVVAFVKPHRQEGETAAPPLLAPGERPAPAVLKQDRRVWMLVLLLGSFTAHAGVYWLLNREPPPLASIGIQSISVEIVLGTDVPAGRTDQDAKSEQEPAQLSKPPAQETAQPEAQQESLQQVEPEPSAPAEIGRADTGPAEAAAAVTSTEQPPTPSVPAPPVLVAPRAKNAVPPLPAAAAKRQTAPAPHPKQQTAPAPHAKQQHPARQRQAMLSATAGAPAISDNGVGRGRSDADTNYRGLVAAHLARYKRFPADARSRGDQGLASVSFSLDGAGRVTSVAIVRGSGFASLDQEVQGMVHRASPFPAPPSGRSMSFTVPVSFRLQ